MDSKLQSFNLEVIYRWLYLEFRQNSDCMISHTTMSIPTPLTEVKTTCVVVYSGGVPSL